MCVLKPETLVELIYCDDAELNRYAIKEKNDEKAKPIVDGYIKLIESEDAEDCPDVVKKIRSAKKIHDDNPNAEYHLNIESILDMYYSNDQFLVSKSKSELYYSYQKIVRKIIADRFSYASGHYQDMFNSGIVGLFNAIKGYNGKFAFSTYSHNFIIHEITKYLNNVSGTGNAYFAKLKRTIRDAVDYFNENKIPVSIKELSAYTGYSEKIVAREYRLLDSTNVYSLDGWTDGSNEMVVSPQIPSPKGSAEDECFESMRNERLYEVLRTLPKIARSIVWRKACYKDSYKDIARDLGMDVADVKAEYKKAIKIIKSKKDYLLEE